MADRDQHRDDGERPLEERRGAAEDGRHHRHAEGLAEVVEGLQPEGDEAEEHRGVHQADHRAAADHPRLEDDLAEDAEEAGADPVGAHAVGLAGPDVADLRGQIADEEGDRQRDQREQHHPLPDGKSHSSASLFAAGRMLARGRLDHRRAARAEAAPSLVDELGTALDGRRRPLL